MSSPLQASGWMRHLLALAMAGLGTAGLYGWFCQSPLSKGLRPQSFAELHPPEAERMNYTAFPSDCQPAAALRSSVPVLRLREYEPGRYELLYWGNPVRPLYTYSIRVHRGRQSVLIGNGGVSQQQRKLPVTAPKRRDGQLPLQPPVRLQGIKGAMGELYAVRVSVHDGRTGATLCWEDYLISGDESPKP